MKTTIFSGIALICLALTVPVCGEEPNLPCRNVKKDMMDVVLWDKYSKQSGLLRISYAGKPVIKGDNNYLTLKDSDGKRSFLQTRFDSAAGYTTETTASGDVIYKSSKKFMKKAGATPMATMDTVMTITGSSVKVQCRATALQDLTFDGYEANPVKMGFGMIAENMKGWTVEAKQGDDLIMAPIEIPFVKEHFNLNKMYDSAVFTGDGMSISITGENCRIRFARYSDKSCEIYLGYKKQTNGAPYTLKKGESYEFTFTVTFAKQQ